MEPDSLMMSAATLLGIAGLGGLLMAVMRLIGVMRPPAWLAMVHGFLAAAALALLSYAAWAVKIPPMAQFALALLLAAAATGAAMNLLFHWKLQPLPIPLMIVHAMLAVVGFILLLTAIFWKSVP